MSEPFARLFAALRDELAALDTGDADTIEAATAAKLAALGVAAAAPPPPAAEIAAAQALNTLALARTRTLLAGVDRRLAHLAAAHGRPPALTYGRDGRTAL